MLGSNVAKYAGENLWKRIAEDEAYKNGQYAVALKNSFLGCDADMKASESSLDMLSTGAPLRCRPKIRISPATPQDVLRSGL